MKGLPMSTRRKDPMASRWSEKILHSCEPLRTHPKKKRIPLPAILSSLQLQKMSSTGNTSQTRFWYIGHAFLCADDVGGLLRFSSQIQTTYFMILHTNSDPSSSGRFSIHSSNLSLPVTCFRICSWQGFSDVCALDLFFQSFVQPSYPGKNSNPGK